jgi:hypothetical protein
MGIATRRVATRAQYDAAFEQERRQVYPVIDEIEQRYGYAIDRALLEAVARVLACPVKKHAANWQHGRVLYAVARKRIAEIWAASAGRPDPERAIRLLDIGTAKGFSAFCLHRALLDAGAEGTVTSVDVIDPLSTDPRNSVFDCEGPHALRDLHAAWPEMAAITFVQSTGLEWLQRHRDRIHIAFIDGKHEGTVVFHEAKSLARDQQPDDITIFDDVHLPSVAQAVNILGQNYYRLDWVTLLPERQYAIGVRR